MKSTLLFTIFLGLHSLGLTATSTGDYSDADHPGKCVIRPYLILPPGTHRDPSDCARIDCSESGHADIYTCGIQGAGYGCWLGDYVAPDADYPACCRRTTICE